MDYEKKYKEAFEIAKAYKGHDVRCALEEIFPVLKESEDERIIRDMIETIKKESKDFPSSVIAEKSHTWLAWIEKQGEQKPYGQRQECVDCQFNYAGECKGSCAMKRGEQKPDDKIESKFHKGDWVIVSTAEGDRVVQIASVEYFKDGHPSYFTTEGRWFGNGTKARLLTDKDVETITIPENKIIVNQKPAWSEEDESYLNTTIAYLKDAKEFKKTAENCIDWLNSLKDRYTWKPSEEQLECLGYVIEKAKKDLSPLTNNRIYLTLKALKEQLEKL